MEQFSSVIWTISGPFATGLYDAGRPDPVFTVGSSDPATEWPAAQPGPLDAVHGYHPAGVTVVFEAAADAADHWHELELEGIASSGPCPDLDVEVGGRRGLVVLHPERIDRAWSPTVQHAIAGPIRRTVALPAGIVASGENRLVLTTTGVESAGESEQLPPQLFGPIASVFGSSLSWSKLILSRRPGPVEPSVSLTPLPLFVEENGGLHELLDVIWSTPGTAGPARAEIVVGDHSESVEVDAVPFGDVRVRLAVPAFEAPVSGRVRIQAPDTEVSWESEVRPCRRWTLHLIPHVHLDIGYTDNQAKVIELHNRNIERVLDVLEGTPDYAFSIDGSFIVRNFLRTRDQERSERALQAVRDGRLGINAFYWLFLSGVASLEECYRAAYFTARLRRDHDVPVTYANLTDVPSYPTAMPSIVSALGLDTFFGIANHTRGGSADGDTLHMLSPVRWEGPDGASVLAYFADSYSQMRFICADPPTLAGAADGFTRFVNRYDRDDYLPDHLPIVGTHIDNEDLAHGYADLVGRWNERYAYPRLRFSTIEDYAQAVRPLLDRLPVLRGDGGSYWEDGVGTQAIAAATHRRTQAVMPAAEALSALVGTVYDGLVADVDEMDAAWEKVLLGSEHTWTSAHATERPHSHQAHDQLAWKVGQINEGWRLANDLARQGLSRLAERVTTGREALIVFNSLPWSRNADVEVELEDGTSLVTPEGEQVPVDAGPLVDGLRRARVLMQDLPPFGYRALALRREGGVDSVVEPAGRGPVFETPHYRIEIDPVSGRLRSLVHSATDRELYNRTSDYALGEVLYVTGGGSEEGRGLGSEVTTLLAPGLPEPELTEQAATMRFVDARRTPWGLVLEAEGEAPSIPRLHARWHFPDADDRVELTVSFDKEAVLAKESVYIAFPFAISDATLRYDRQQGWVNPAEDHQPGACNEWFTIAGAVTLSGAEGSVAWASADAPLFVLGDVVRGRWSTQPPAPTGTVLSWVMNNYWVTNTPASQQGSIQLRYAFRPGETFDPVGATRLGRELRTPALAGEVTFLDKGDSDPRPLAPRGSLLRAELAEHVDATVFAGRLAPGTLIRLREVSGRPAIATVWHPEPSSTAEAHRCTAAEEPQTPLDVAADGAVTVGIAPYEVVTVLLTAGSLISDQER